MVQVAHDHRLTKMHENVVERVNLVAGCFSGRGRCLQWAAKPAYKSDWEVLRHHGLLLRPRRKHARKTLIPGLPAGDIQKAVDGCRFYMHVAPDWMIIARR